MEIKNEQELEVLLKEEPALLLYFYNDTCAPCVALRPKVKQLTEEQFPKLKTVFVNAQQFPSLASTYSIFSSPTILVLFDGREVTRESKYVSVDELGGKIERYYSLYFE